jgi:flagella basal body P-ring formation protein FlgA
MTPAFAIVSLAAGCQMVDGNRILGRDLAAASPLFAGVAAAAEIGYAPQPGARRVMEAAEVARLAARFGLDPKGATSLCFERRTAAPDEGRMAQAMRAALAPAAARIEIVEYNRRPVPAGDYEFPANALMSPAFGRDTALWNGAVRYEGGRYPIWARVRVAVREAAVVAATALRPGQTIAADDVKVEEIESFPRRRAVAAKLEDVVGRVARRAIAAGAAIAPDALDEPLQVAKGDPVEVEVRSGRAVLRLEARAEAAGRRGQLIPVRNPDSGKIFRARVRSKGQVVMECGSGN